MDEDRIKQLEEQNEHQRECIDWLKMIIENLTGSCSNCGVIEEYE